MRYGNNLNLLRTVVYGIQDPIITDPDAIKILLTNKLLNPEGLWIVRQRSDPFQNTTGGGFRQMVELPLSGTLEKNLMGQRWAR